MAGVIPKETADLIKKFCMECESTDAVSIADKLMEMECVRMRGPEHHYLVSAVLLTAYCNEYKIEKKEMLVKAYVRVNTIPVGVCALYGSCGTVMGAGAAVSILLSVNPFSKEDLQRVNLITAGVQSHLAKYGGPRCCKRAVWIAVSEAVRGMNRCMGCNLPVTLQVCKYTKRNSECQAAKCEFYIRRGYKKVTGL
ncbi:hypothetical protein D3Z53_26130 [Lachnospiraceae bacterium]|jgi:hypothetical protein|nr:DUF5714 domain-containing protein [uncultured Schaedlerella sp.]EOS40055.1 hypothetical protein C808_01026 [Lachnospiraceae bacterium M18-1]MCI9155301.1 hypothetical protein [Ruminococcus sp.]NBI61370.1 hypothetical protein [Lachnospiraceae bacterium]